MSFPTVERCCCFRLKTAGILIGIFSLLINVFALYMIFVTRPIIEKTDNPIKYRLEVIPFSIITLTALFWIYGIRKDLFLPMFPFFLLSFIGLIVTTTAPFLCLFYFSATQTDPATGFMIFICLCCLGAFNYYIWIVQYSLYKSIQEGHFSKRQTQILSQAI